MRRCSVQSSQLVSEPSEGTIFLSWPGINSADAMKHLQPSISTAKGHLDHKRKNIQPTATIKHNKSEIDNNKENIRPTATI